MKRLAKVLSKAAVSMTSQRHFRGKALRKVFISVWARWRGRHLSPICDLEYVFKFIYVLIEG